MLRTLTHGGADRDNSPSPSAHRLRGAAAALSALCESLREGLTAQRQYEHLTSKGIEHRDAIRTAFGMPQPAAPVRPRTCRALQREPEPVEQLLCSAKA